MRSFVSLVVVMMLASASLEGQAGPRGGAPQPARPVKVETPPVPVPAAKPAVDTHAAPVPGTQVAPAKPVVQGPAKPVAEAAAAHAPAKPAAHGPAAPAATQAKAPVPAPAAKAAAHAPAPKPAAPPTKSLEQAAESITAALAARGVKPAARSASASDAPAPRAPRIKRYLVYWPPDDTHWDVRWPVISGRVALTWDEPSATADQPASH